MANDVKKFTTSKKMLDWQYFQILGDLQEIQRHDSDPTCPCRLSEDLNENFLAKHSLGLSVIAAETAAMDAENSNTLYDLSAEAKEKHEVMKGFYCHTKDEPEFTEWSRQWRKRIEPLYYRQSCKVKLKQEMTCTLNQFEKMVIPKEQMGFDFEALKCKGPVCAVVAPPKSSYGPAIGPPKFQPFQFQAEGIAWLKGRHFALLADDMGLGKTNQAIYWVANDNLFPALVIVPAALPFNWQKEITQVWLPGDTATILDGQIKLPSTLPRWTIVTYGQLPKYLPQLRRTGFKAVIIDEAHLVKNLAAQRTKNLLNLVAPEEPEPGDRPIPNRLAVTGTPILNRPIELFALMVFLGVKKRSDYNDFLNTYTEHKKVQGRTIFTGAKNLSGLHYLLKSFMIRRLKKDVLKQLPPKINTPLFVAISNKAEYLRVERDFIEWLREKSGDEAAARASKAEIITRMNALRQIAAMGKVAPVCDWLKPCYEDGGKVIVFSSFPQALKDLKKCKGEGVIYDGTVSSMDRQAMVDDFQKGDGCYFFGSIGAAGVGITLTAANRVAFMDLPWTPGGKSQAEDRAYRIGQTRTVEVVNVLARGTIDERMLQILSDKEKVIAQAIDGRTKEAAENTSIAQNLMDSFLSNPSFNQRVEQYQPEEKDQDIDQIDIAEGFRQVKYSEHTPQTLTMNEPLGIIPPEYDAFKVQLELKRSPAWNIEDAPKIDSPANVQQLFRLMRNADREWVMVICLDTRLRLVGLFEMSIGNADTAIVSPQEVARIAIHTGAVSVILAHNHPSGDPDPSDADRRLHIALKASLKALEIELPEFFVVGHRSDYSFTSGYTMTAPLYKPLPPARMPPIKLPPTKPDQARLIQKLDTVIDPPTRTINKTFRLHNKTLNKWVDITADSLEAAQQFLFWHDDDIDIKKVWKSSGKINEGGSVVAGWGKVEKPKELWQMPLKEFREYVMSGGYDFKLLGGNNRYAHDLVQNLINTKKTGNNVDVAQKSFDYATEQEHMAIITIVAAANAKIPKEVLTDYPDLLKRKFAEPKKNVQISGHCGASADTCAFTVKRKGEPKVVTKEVTTAKITSCKVDKVDGLIPVAQNLLEKNKCTLHQEPSVRISGTCQMDGCSLKVKGALETVSTSDAAGLSDAINSAIKKLEKRKESVVTSKTFAPGISTSNRYEFEFQVKEASDLIVSHDPVNFQPNPKYISKIQPRLRERLANQLQVKKIARGLDPEKLLMDTKAIDTGCPIIDETGLVLCGNGRVLALQIAEREYPANIVLYKMALKDIAGSYGLTVSESMKMPVLVRLLLTLTNKQAFAEECNARPTIEASAIEKARTDADKITPAMLASLDVLEGEAIERALRSERNKPFVSAFIGKLPENEQALLIDARGMLNSDGVRRMGMAIFVATFKGDVGLRLAEKFFESIDDTNVKNAFNGIVRSLAPMAQAEHLVATGQRYPGLAFGEDLAKTITVFSNLKAADMSVEKYLSQSQMLERQLSPFQERVLITLEEYSRSAKRIGNILSYYAQAVIESPPPGQSSLMPIDPPSKERLFAQAVKQVQSEVEAERIEREAKKKPIPETITMSQEPEIWKLTSDEYVRREAEKMAARWDTYKNDPVEKAKYIKRFIRRQGTAYSTIHRRIVARSINAGFPVPPNVRAEYPDIETQNKPTLSYETLKIGNKSFNLAPEVKQGMNFLATNTLRTGKEFGMDICQKTDGALITGMTCKGSSCQVYIHDCAGLKKVADYHTHPTKHTWLKSMGEGHRAEQVPLSPEVSIIPSAQDIRLTQRDGFSCVGSPHTNNVTCWTRNEGHNQFSCPKKRAWAYTTDDVPEEFKNTLEKAKLLCSGVKDVFDFTTIKRQEVSVGTGNAENQKEKATEKIKDEFPSKNLILKPYPTQGRLFSYEMIKRLLAKCNLTDSELDTALNYRPLRNLLATAIGWKDVRVQLCSAGLVPGVYQVTIDGLTEKNDEKIMSLAKHTKEIKQVYTKVSGQRVFETVVPESRPDDVLTWTPQEVSRKVQREPAEQVRMFKGKCPVCLLHDKAKAELRFDPLLTAISCQIGVGCMASGKSTSQLPVCDAGQKKDREKIVKAIRATLPSGCNSKEWNKPLSERKEGCVNPFAIANVQAGCRISRKGEAK